MIHVVVLMVVVILMDMVMVFLMDLGMVMIYPIMQIHFPTMLPIRILII